MKNRILVAILTRQRPEMLEECLRSVIIQSIPDDCDIRILVVENDLRESVRGVCDRLAKLTKLPLDYVLETDLGIPFGRNRAIEEAVKQECNWLGSIDDDELAEQDWLRQLIEAAIQYRADVVQGWVKARYPEGDRWSHLLEKSDDKVIEKEGRLLQTAASGNVIISSRVFSCEGMGVRFDTAMSYTGGSDTEFFDCACRLGGRIVFSARPVVSESVPIERCKLTWLFTRSARSAAAGVYIDAKQLPKKQLWKKHLGRALINLVGFFRSLFTALFYLFLDRIKSKKAFVKANKKIARAYGRLLGLSGRMLEPYKEIDGA